MKDNNKNLKIVVMADQAAGVINSRRPRGVHINNDMRKFIAKKYRELGDIKLVLNEFKRIYGQSSEITLQRNLKKYINKESKFFQKFKIDYDFFKNFYDKKYKKLFSILNEQIIQYLRDGTRKYSQKNLKNKKITGAGTIETIMKFRVSYLKLLFGSKVNAQTLNLMMFGDVKKSHQDIKQECEDKDFTLLTTLKEWISIVEYWSRNKNKFTQGGIYSCYVRVKCNNKNKPHISLKTIVQLFSDECGCHDCHSESMKINYSTCVQLGHSRGLKLITPQDDVEKAIEHSFTKYEKKSGQYTIMRWKHIDCGYEFDRTYKGVRDNVGVCPMCDSENKNQILTHKITEHIFGGYGVRGKYFSSEKMLTEIIPIDKIITVSKDFLLKKSIIGMHIDIYTELKFKINGKEKIIDLGVEYQGKHHRPTQQGLKEFISLSRNTKGKVEWRHLLFIDAFKVKLFQAYNNNGYYLVVVPDTVKPAERQAFIIEEFYKQTGIPGYKLNSAPINWKKL